MNKGLICRAVWHSVSALIELSLPRVAFPGPLVLGTGAKMGRLFLNPNLFLSAPSLRFQIQHHTNKWAQPRQRLPAKMINASEDGPTVLKMSWEISGQEQDAINLNPSGNELAEIEDQACTFVSSRPTKWESRSYNLRQITYTPETFAPQLCSQRFAL